jgi:hypothetical protein
MLSKVQSFNPSEIYSSDAVTSILSNPTVWQDSIKTAIGMLLLQFQSASVDRLNLPQSW